MANQREGFIRKGLLSTTGLFVLLVIFILINVLLSYASIRWDATDESIYSLSPGTEKILSGLKHPVTFKIFYTSSNPQVPIQIKAYAKRVIEFLSEYKNASNGKVKVEVLDPRPDSDEEEWAQKYGLEGMTAGAGDRIYFGIVALSADQEETIPFLDPSREQLLEYDISRLIVTTETDKKKIIGVLSFLPVFGEKPPGMRQPFPQEPAPEPWYFIADLKKTCEVREISMNAGSIDNDIDLLLIIYPKRLPWRMPYLVDQYIVSGKNAVVYMDPLCLSDPEAGPNQLKRLKESALDPLLKAWKVSLIPGEGVADMDQPTRVRNQFGMVEDNPMWISARGESLSKKSIITAGLDNLLLPVAGAFQQAKEPYLEMETLVQSGKNSDLVDAFNATLGARMIQQDFSSQNKAYPLMVKLSGKFKSAFPDGPPENPEDDGQGTPKMDASRHKKEADKSATVLLIGDADNLNDAYYLQKQNMMGFLMVRVFNDNLNLLQNACELLTGGDALISIRSRGKFERPFLKVKDLESQAKKKWMDKEKELMRKAEETNRMLQQMEQNKDVSEKLIVTPEQRTQIEKFKEQKKKIDKELKAVRKNLRADIESLGLTLKIINIGLMPLAVALVGIGFGLYRQRKSRRK